MKNPKLKIKYANGLGDLVACFLHSKYIGWLTKLITGRDEPCKVCSERIKALNVLVPIKIWKFYFKDQNDMLLALSKEYTIYNNIKEEKINPPKVENNIKGYSLINSSDTVIGELLIRLQTFKIK